MALNMMMSGKPNSNNQGNHGQPSGLSGLAGALLGSQSHQGQGQGSGQHSSSGGLASMAGSLLGGQHNKPYGQAQQQNMQGGTSGQYYSGQSMGQQHGGSAGMLGAIFNQVTVSIICSKRVTSD
jgi:hypothetical protein